MHGFTTRAAGNLSYDATASRPAAGVTGLRARLLGRLAATARARFSLVTLEQKHSALVRVIDTRALRGRREPDGTAKLAGDALVSARPGWLLAVQAADCLPILLVDPVRHVVANVHAGWRGTLARIAEKTVGEMRRRFDAAPRRLLAVIGPGIHACCYEVGREVQEAFAAQFVGGEKFFRRLESAPSETHWHPKVRGRPLKPFGQPGRETRAPAGPATEPTRWFLDLVAANRQQLRRAGLGAANITVLDYCTACRTDLFFSHRAERGRTGRQMALIGIRE